MTEIVITRRASDDFRRIWRYVALDNVTAADRLLLAIDKKIEFLREHPDSGAPRPEINPRARVLVHGSYLILYEHNRVERVVRIIAIVEGMRDLERLF